MGLIINRSAPDLQLPELLVQLGIVETEDAIRLHAPELAVQVLKGGPVETGRGFVLHTSDYFIETSTMPVDEGVCLTHTVDVLKAIASGGGPRQAFLALGYAGWGAGQLEQEIQANGWLHCDADPSLLFDISLDTKYQRAMSKLGVDPARLSSTAGHG